MYAVLGWINVTLVGLMLLPYVMRKLNEFFFKIKKGPYIKLMRFLRKYHRFIGIPLVISVIAHGWLALGGLSLHTGTVAGIMILITAFFGAIFALAKKRWAFNAHKALAIAFIVLLIVHLVVPSLLYYIF